MTTKQQIEKLANFVMAEVPGEPSRSEGAVDCAIRVIKRLQAQTVHSTPGELCDLNDYDWQGTADKVVTAFRGLQIALQRAREHAHRT